MNTALFDDHIFRVDTKNAKVHLVIKKRDMTYFTEQVVFKKEISIFFFLLLLPLLFVLLSLFMLLSTIHSFWHKFLFFLFRERDLISPEEAHKRLRERSLIDKMTPEEKAKLFSKKDLPLGL